MNKKLIFKDLHFFLAIMIVLSLPLSIEASNLAILLFILNWLVEANFSTKWALFKSNVLVWLFIGLFVVFASSLLYSYDIAEGVGSLEQKLSFIIFPLVFSTTNFTGWQIKRILETFILSCLIASLLCLIYSIHIRYSSDINFAEIDWAHFSWSITRPLKFHAPYFSMYLVFSIFIVIWLIKERTKSKGLFIKIILIAYLFMFVALLSSRMALFSLLLISSGLIIYYYLSRGKIIQPIVAVLVIGLLGVMVYKNVPYLKKRIDNGVLTKGLQANPRYYTFQAGLNILQENLILGVGIGDVEDLLQQEYLSLGFQEGYANKYNTHSQYLEILVQLGIVGLLYFLLALSLPMKLALKNQHYLYIVFLILLSICCLTEVLLDRQKGIVFYSFFNSLFAFNLAKTS